VNITVPQDDVSPDYIEVVNADGSTTWEPTNLTEQDLEDAKRADENTRHPETTSDDQLVTVDGAPEFNQSNAPRATDPPPENPDNPNTPNTPNQPETPNTPNTPQNPTPPQDLVNNAENARIPDGNAAAATADINGNLYTATSGDGTQSPAGIGDGSTCAECHLGQVITENYGDGSLDGQTINVGVAQVRGRPPCPTCQGMFGQLARYTGANIRVWWGIRAPGGVLSRGPIIGVMGPLEFGP
jgi:hypothetical protein